MDIRVISREGSTARIRKNNTLVSTVNATEMKIVNSGYATLAPGWKTDAAVVPYNRLYLIESGTGLLQAGERSLPMEPGKAYLLPVGLPCGYRCSSIVTKLFVDFNLFMPNRYDLLQGFSQIGVLELPEGSPGDILARYSGGSFADSLWLQNRILELVYAFHEKYGFGNRPLVAYSALVADTIDYIRRNLSARLRVAELADRCFVSRTYLTEQFRREVGITLGRYIDEQLISLAQRQLSRTEDSIEKISNDLGFCNPFYFSKCFKKSSGLSPLQYRKNTPDRR